MLNTNKINLNTMSGKITISNEGANVAVIDIEGVIGVPEDHQFDENATSVATYKTFKEVIEKIKSLGQTEVIVNIRSTGGNVNDALLIHDSLKTLNAKITTRCFGYVASAATIIAQAASNGLRELSANSLYLVHKSECSAEGNAQAIAQTIDLLDKTDKRITAIYADRAGKQVSEFAKLMAENNGNGRWLSPDEVIAHGLADKIISAAPIKADAKNMVINLGLPPIPRKRKNMVGEISNKWNHILRSIGLAQGNDNQENNAADLFEGEVIDATSLEIATQEIIAVQNKEKTEMGGSNKARMAALPTSTKPKEDPAIQDIRLSANEGAYMEDIKKFIGQ